MKKIVTTFGVAVLLLNLVALYILSSPANSTPQFIVITSDINDRSGLLNVSNRVLAEIADGHTQMRNIDAEMAFRIAYLVIFGRLERELQQPYMVYHDTENDFFIRPLSKLKLYTFRNCKYRQVE